MNSPFKFLDAFTLKDNEYFFGREQEVKTLYQMVFETPILLIYGLSGTGKTSLVQCGLASRFDGPDWFPFFIRRNENINESLHAELNECIDSEWELSLNEKISYLTTHYLRPVYLIFDQLEELFILGPEEEKVSFIQAIKQLLDANLHCKIILIIREEYRGELYNFENVIPYIFEFRLRVEAMEQKKAVQVVASSFKKFNIKLEEPEGNRIKQILDNVSGEKSGIELPYLQVYLDRLYRQGFENAFPEGIEKQYPPLKISEKEINDLGKIDDVLGLFLEEQKKSIHKELQQLFSVPENTVSDILNILVTKRGTKQPITFERVDELIQMHSNLTILLPNISEQAFTYVIEALAKRRIIRFVNDTTFELAHDSLAKIIREKLTEEERLKIEVLPGLLEKFEEYPETKEYLSKSQLERYRPFIPVFQLSQEIHFFIDESEKHIEFLRKKEANSKLRKKLLWAIGTVAVFTLLIAFYAFKQKNNAIESEKRAKISEEKAIEKEIEAKELNYKNLLDGALLMKAKGNFDDAKIRANNALTYYKNESLNLSPNQEIPLPDSLRKLKKNWVEVESLLTQGNDFFLESKGDSLYSNNDLLLKKAYDKFEDAYELDDEKYILGEINKIKAEIIYKYTIWKSRAIGFASTGQCEYADEAFYFVKELNYPRDSTRTKEITLLHDRLKFLKKMNNCY